MRFALPFTVLIAISAPAAEPLSTASYLRSMEKLIDVLGAVTDEKSALDAKLKIENFTDEARAAREHLFKQLADVSDEAVVVATLKQMTERLTEADAKFRRQFDRLAADHKPAYKVLRTTKPFVVMEKEREATAARQARELVDSVRIYGELNGGKRPAQLADIAKTPEDAKKYLLDPWGYPFQYKVGEKRVHVWTVSPYSGEKLGSPPLEEK